MKSFNLIDRVLRDIEIWIEDMRPRLPMGRPPSSSPALASLTASLSQRTDSLTAAIPANSELINFCCLVCKNCTMTFKPTQCVY